MAHILGLVWLAGLIVHAALPAAQNEQAGIFTLVIPASNIRLSGNATAVLPPSTVSHLQIQIDVPPGQVPYGNIFARINTESANIVMTISATATGINCDFDLTRRQGFRLKVGRNSVEIAIQDQRGRVRYASFLLEQSVQAADTRKALPAVAISGERHALIVGIARYDAPGGGIRSLALADRDATGLRDFLASPAGGYRPENVRLLLNEDATLEHIRAAFADLASRAAPDDMVVVSLSGHGVADPDDRRRNYLLAHDSRPDALGSTAMPFSELEDFFGRALKARAVATILDVARPNAFARPAPDGNNLVHQYLTRYASGGSRAVLAAADVGESSWDAGLASEGTSVFGRFLLAGLRGEADANRDGTVTFGELKVHVREQVRKTTAGQQSPVGTIGDSDALALGGLGTRSK